MDDPLTPEEEREVLAAELALGVLDGAARAEALRLQLSDPAFAQSVHAWEARLAPLHGHWAAVAPRDAVWNAVAARIGEAGAQDALRASVRRWRGATLLSGALAAGLGALLLLRPAAVPEQKPTPVAIAQVAGEAGAALLVARYDPGSSQMTVRIAGLASGPLAPELWVIPDGGAPLSLGGIPRTGTMAVPMTEVQRRLLVDGATLAISMEPADGMPHSAPSSTPIATGKITVL